LNCFRRVTPGRVARDFADAIIADKRYHAFQCSLLSLKSLLQSLQRPSRNCPARDPERVPRSTDAFSNRLQQFVGNAARIGPANCPALSTFSVILNASVTSVFNTECRSATTDSSGVFVVVMQDKLDRHGGNVVHEIPLNAAKARKNNKRTSRKSVAVKQGDSGK